MVGSAWMVSEPVNNIVACVVCFGISRLTLGRFNPPSSLLLLLPGWEGLCTFPAHLSTVKIRTEERFWTLTYQIPHCADNGKANKHYRGIV